MMMMLDKDQMVCLECFVSQWHFLATVRSAIRTVDDFVLSVAPVLSVLVCSAEYHDDLVASGQGLQNRSATPSATRSWILVIWTLFGYAVVPILFAPSAWDDRYEVGAWEYVHNV